MSPHLLTTLSLYFSRMSFGSPLVTIDVVDASMDSASGPFSDDMIVAPVLSRTYMPRNNDVRGENLFHINLFFRPFYNYV